MVFPHHVLLQHVYTRDGSFLILQFQVAHRLRESNKALCRNLKENPNVQGNLIKMQQERLRVQEQFEGKTFDVLVLLNFKL